MNNTLKTTNEILKGCLNIVMDGNEDGVCGHKSRYCPSCKSKLLARKQAQEEELEFLNNRMITELNIIMSRATDDEARYIEEFIYFPVKYKVENLQQSIKLIGELAK